MKIKCLAGVFTVLTILSNTVFAEAVGDKDGYLKQVSSQQLDSQLHTYLISQIKIDNPQPYTNNQTHHHRPIWGCTKAIKHKHNGARNHAHKYGCRGRPSHRRYAPVAVKKMAGFQASSTNVQEKGVDESDFVKTDGRYLFAITNDVYRRRPAGIRIFDTKSSSKQPKQIATLGFQKGLNLTGMYLMPQKNRLILVGNSYGKPLRKKLNRWSGVTSVITIDIRNRAKPKVIQHVKMEGHSRTTRRIGNQLYMVLSGSGVSFPSTYQYLETSRKMTPKEYDKVKQEMVTEIKKWSIKSDLPHYRVLGKSGIKPLMKSSSFLLNPGNISRYSMSTLVAIDLAASDFQFKTSNYFGYTGTVYVSNKALYLTPSYAPRVKGLDKTRFPNGVPSNLIHKFAFHKSKGFDYRGTGAVLGGFGWRGNSSFQLDEDSKGNLRVVTSNWNSRTKHTDPAANSPVVLTALAEHPRHKQLITLSRLPNRQQPKALGKKGEQLYGVRLFNDYAYFVTFKRTDPLYVVDMRNPRGMRVVGELEIPGFSDYLHPISQNLLVGVGKKASKDGRVEGLKVSLFDISNPRNPREIHKIHLGESGTESPVSRNHHAFTSLKMKNSPITRISLPISLVANSNNYTTESGLYQFEVNNRTRKIKHVGQILPPKRNKRRWYWNNDDRSIIINNKLYFYNNGNFLAGIWGQKDKSKKLEKINH